jgi:hypothetical protein
MNDDIMQTLKMKATCSSETLVLTNKSTSTRLTSTSTCNLWSHLTNFGETCHTRVMSVLQSVSFIHLNILKAALFMGLTNSVAPEPVGSLPYSQEPATGPYPETTGSTLLSPSQSPQRSILHLFSNLCLGLPSGLFPSGFPTKTWYTSLPSPMRATCPVHLILLDVISLKLFGLSTNYEALIVQLPPISCYSPSLV